ncbi:ABC transporter substrate-binding protein [Microbacterium sp. NPDC077644]|uniref:ABC transporter substrate-binding protein n=1 Tax=Microbacterium sp. NPDC077644 TaxID=3155055 RepID=UPI00344B709B
MMTTHKKRSVRGLAAIAIASVFALSACGATDSGSSSGEASEDPFKILYIAGLSGGAVNTDVTQAFEASVELINEKGGLLGREVEVEFADSQNDATKAVTVLQEYLQSNPKPDLVIPGVGTGEALALLPVLTREKILAISTASSPLLDDPEEYPYFFSVSARQDALFTAASEFLEDKGDVKKIALVVTDNALRQAAEPQFTEKMTAAGFETTVIPFDPANVNVAPAFTKAKEWGADWIYFESFGESTAHGFAGREKAGAEDIPMLGGSGVAVSDFLDFATDAQRENFFPILYPVAATTAEEDRDAGFNAFYDALSPVEELPLKLGSYSFFWDMPQVWAAGVRQADSVETEAVTDALTNLEVQDSDAMWVTWQKLYGPDTHFPIISSDEFTIAEVAGMEDRMYVIKE